MDICIEMETKRLFLSIPIGHKMTKLCQQFIALQKLDNIRWIKPVNWHITLVFLGSFPIFKIHSLSLHLEDYFSKFNSFELHFEKFIYKADIHNPTMIWTKFKASVTFDHLVRLTFDHLREFYLLHQIPFDISIRQHNIPHVTLARVRQEYQHFPKLIIDSPAYPPLAVKNCHLFESILLPNGAKYNLLHNFSLSQNTN